MVSKTFFMVCKDLSVQKIFGLRSIKSSQTTLQFPQRHEWKSVLKRCLVGNNDSQLKSFILRVNETFNVFTVVIRKQCCVLLAQRLQRGCRIIEMYSRLYERQQLQDFIKSLHSQLMRKGKDRSLIAMFGAVLFSWEQNGISDEEVQR